MCLIFKYIALKETSSGAVGSFAGAFLCIESLCGAYGVKAKPVKYSDFIWIGFFLSSHLISLKLSH